MDLLEYYWLAGLLEGEGYFRLKNAPGIFVRMNDKDVVQKAHRIMGCTTKVDEIYRANNKSTQPSYEARIYGEPSVALMCLLYPLMGQRRKAAILSIVDNWNGRPRTVRQYQVMTFEEAMNYIQHDQYATGY